MLKIKYHYEFPNLPINDNDIQALYEKMTDILWSAEGYLPEFSQQEIILPDIFVSDEIVPILGEFNHNRNRIILYINTIIDYFSNSPCEDAALKIKTGLEIVLANEVFQAIHFHMIGYNHQNRIDNWNVSPQHNAFRNSVVEGLAKWFEYTWCDENQYNNEIYAWHKEQIETELGSNCSATSPHTSANAFLKNGTIFYDNAISVFNASIQNTQSHWCEAYILLEDFCNNNF